MSVNKVKQSEFYSGIREEKAKSNENRNQIVVIKRRKTDSNEMAKLCDQDSKQTV